MNYSSIRNIIVPLAIIFFLAGCGEESSVLNLTADPTVVSQNGSTTLEWSSGSDVTNCIASGDWSGSKDPSGTEVISGIQADSTFNLSCTGADGAVNASVSVTVETIPPTSVSLSATPTTVSLNGTTTLSWSSNADSCTASGSWSGTKNPSGEETLTSLMVNSTYHLSCTGQGGTAQDTVSVAVEAEPAPETVTVNLVANPSTVSLNGSINLSWQSTNAVSCTASGDWSGSKSTSGMETIVSVTQDATYNLSCTGPGGTVQDSVSVVVDTMGVTVNLTADPSSVPYNGSTTLTWTSRNSNECTASGDWSGSKGVSGTETISSLTADSQFIISCSNSDGSANDSVGVTVTPNGNGTALLSWTPPTENTDGSALTDLAGYRIYYGTAPNSYTDTITINSPGISSYQINNLTAADWYFVVTSLNSSGVESTYSTEVSKTIN